MDESHSEADVSLSPSQILERLQMLRQLQLLQRGKLQKQSLQYKDTSETSSSITEIVSHFSNSTSYNTFRSLLQSSNDISNEGTPRLDTSNYAQKLNEKDLIEGVSVLNLSQESEFIVSSPLSSRSRASASTKRQDAREYDKDVSTTTNNILSQNTNQKNSLASSRNNSSSNFSSKKQISLDEMPILSPKQNFEALVLEKLQHEKTVPKPMSLQKTALLNKNKKTFLKKGEGIARFGLKKNAIVIQNTKSLPWKRKSFQNKNQESPLKESIKELKNKKSTEHPTEPELLVPKLQLETLSRKPSHNRVSHSSQDEEVSDQHIKHPEASNELKTNIEPEQNHATIKSNSFSVLKNLEHIKGQKLEFKNKHPLVMNKGKTWAAVLTKEQNDFLRQLKQSDYYKNFDSPTKNVLSDASCDDTMSKIRLEKEVAEQKMFELLENKVCHESFNLENSFFNCFLRKSNIEYSGESTPLVMQKCLSENPNLIHIFPDLHANKRQENSYSDVETCCSNSNCCCDTCSTVSCCSCKTVEQTTNSTRNVTETERSKKSSTQTNKKVMINSKEVNIEKNQLSNQQDDIMTETDMMKANMADMNAKLAATSELLKDRLHELEDEIETFRKENANLAKLREEVDHDRQKFYEEKAAFEQKLNEEKVLAEYYLAEEKEKLSKQKQMYERYVREIRGRLNKKDKDEVVNLKTEINSLKEEIRIKDAKSTSTIARLRNQIKIMEKEKKELQEEVEKLKKQNRRIQHSNEVTRRLTNIKYLEEINKKLTNLSSKETRSEVNIDHDMKYKAYEIERQSRSRKVEPAKGIIRPRAKSVPNLNVTSRYAKYFSQRDTASQREQHRLLNIDISNDSADNVVVGDDDNISIETQNDDAASVESDNYLEKMYNERFRSSSPQSTKSNDSNSKYSTIDKSHLNENTKDFFIQKPNSGLPRNSKSPRTTISPNLNTNDTYVNRSKSPVSILSNKSSSNRSSNSHLSAEYISRQSDNSQNKSKSPVFSFNHSSLRSATVIHNSQFNDQLLSVSPEPTMIKTNVSKTNLNPTELRNADGSRELRFPNGNVKYIAADGKYSKFVYYNGDVKENFYDEGRIKYFYAETKTYHTTHADGLEVLEFPDGQVEKRYKDGSSEIRLPNGSIRYFDPKNKHVREEWRFPDGAALTVSANGERRVVFSNGQIEVHAKDHKRREFPDGTVKLVYNDGTSETRYASGRVRIKDKHGNLIMDSAPD